MLQSYSVLFTLAIVVFYSLIIIIGKTRLRRLGHNFSMTGQSPKENRGGYRPNEKYDRLHSSIIAFIKTLTVRQSHYSRRKTTRQYLPSELTITKLYKMWCDKQKAENKPTASKAFFTNIFYNKFNLGFGRPSTDICSTCVALEKKIENSENDVDEHKVQLKVHKKRADRFYQIIRESRQLCDTFSIIFDMQKNQPLPKIGLTQEYYKRQMWFYTLGFVVNDGNEHQKNVRFYVWSEFESGKGSNEICSALMDFLRRFKKRIAAAKYRNLDLICDSCPGQNKNSTLLYTLLRYFNDPSTPFQTGRVIFPIRGHSYTACDRVFGRIEQQYQKISRFTTPQSYYDVLQKFGKIRKLGTDWSVFDYKKLADSRIKDIPKFGIRDTKIWMFRKRSLSFETTTTYFGNPNKCTVKQSIRNRRGNPFFQKPLLLAQQTHVSEAKRRDVRELLQYVTLTAEEEDYYNKALKEVSAKKGDEKSVYPLEVE